MRKFLIAAAAVTALSAGSASAADLAARPYTKAPMLVAPIFDWSGFYIGGNVGGGWSRSSFDNEFTGLPPNLNYSMDSSSVVGGGQIGYNWQFAPNWVLGIEGMYSGGKFDSNNTQLQVGFLRTATTSFDSFWDVVGRIGYASNNWLFYARGGYTGAQVDRTVFRTFDGLLQSTDSHTASGYVVGAGVEYGFTPNWIFGVEYNYRNYDVSDRLAVNVPPTVLSNFRNVDLELHTVTARLSYKFGGPIVAKY